MLDITFIEFLVIFLTLTFYFIDFLNIFFNVTMAMRHLKLGDRNRVIAQYYLDHLGEKKVFTIHHFVENYGLARTTVRRAIQRADRIRRGRRDTLDRHLGSGRPHALTRRQERQCLRGVENKKGPSTKRQARRFGVTPRTVRNILHRQGAKAPKRQKAPEISDEQMERIDQRSALLSRDFFPVGGRTEIVIDDESYFTLKGDEVRGNDRVWTRDISTCPPEVRFKQKPKFAKKLLVHCAISPKGVSELSFVEGGYAINRHAYIQILRSTVVPFIRRHHSNGRYYFWMDLASAHYANDTLAFLRQEGIRFVPKHANPPCVASLRPVEDFWAALKKAVYDEGWEASSLPALKRRIKQKAREIPLPTILHLFHTIKERLAQCARDGYWAVHR